MPVSRNRKKHKQKANSRAVQRICEKRRQEKQMRAFKNSLEEAYLKHQQELQEKETQEQTSEVIGEINPSEVVIEPEINTNLDIDVK